MDQGRLWSPRLASLIAGDFRRLPRVSIQDIQPLQESQDVLGKHTTLKATDSRCAFALLNGKIPIKYRSRSKAEQALIAKLVNSVDSYESVLGSFLKYPCAG